MTIVLSPESDSTKVFPLARARYSAAPSIWRAELELWFAISAGKTRLVRRRHFGPLVVQKPFHPLGDDSCHIYLLHPPGGVAGGDQIDLRFHIEAGARALLTTPGATKFYRSDHGACFQRATVDVGAGAVCEYFPQESIIFDGADAVIDTNVSLEAGATYVGWDFTCLGRPAAKERFETGNLVQRVKIIREGRPVWFERLQLPGGSRLAGAPYALAGKSTWGTMVYIGPTVEDAAERVRNAVGVAAGDTFSVSQIDDVVVCRYLGARVSEGRSLFVRAWDALRVSCQGKAACAPRIWAT